MILLFAFSFAIDASSASEQIINRYREKIREGQLAESILGYREALREWPTHRGLQDDLTAARELVAERPGVPRIVNTFDWLDRVNPRVFIVAYTGFVGITALALMAYFTKRPRWSLPLGMLALLGVAASLALHHQSDSRRERERTTPLGVIARDTALHEGNGEAYPRKLDLPAGLEVVVRHTRRGWARIELSNGVTGWVRSDDLLNLNG